jgi:biopolymer transport protein ExbB
MSNLLHLAPIATSGIVAATLIAERVKSLYLTYNIDSKKFLTQIEGHVQKGNIQGAIDLCASNEKALLPKVVKAGLVKGARDESEIRTALEVALLDCSGHVNQRIGYLAMIANVATLLGLLGTIGGLISSFEAVASADAATKQSLLASGISTSMNATALGLVVAIPVMIAFSILNGRANKIMDELEKAAGKTLAMLHGRLYLDSADDFSKIGFEGVDAGNAEEAKVTSISSKTKGAA